MKADKVTALLQAIHKLRLPHFTSKSLIPVAFAALLEYFGERSEGATWDSPYAQGTSKDFPGKGLKAANPISVGKVLEWILKRQPKDAPLRLEGILRTANRLRAPGHFAIDGKSLNVREWRVIDAAARVTTDKTRQVELPSMLATTDRDGHITREPVLAGGIHSKPADELPAYVRRGVWERTKDGDFIPISTGAEPPRDPLRPPVGLPMNRWTRAQLLYEKQYLQRRFGPTSHPAHSTDWFIRACQARNAREY